LGRTHAGTAKRVENEGVFVAGGKVSELFEGLSRMRGWWAQVFAGQVSAHDLFQPWVAVLLGAADVF